MCANRNQFGLTAIVGRKPVRKQALMFASCSLWVLFLSAPACLAQSVVALDKPSQQEERMKSCLESTCRNVPNREKLTAINLSKRYIRGIFGGFEQGAGIAGGVQLTSADTIPAVELRTTVLASSRFYRRFDAEAYLPNIRGSRNHADVWFGYSWRESNFFGIGPRLSEDLKTHFALEQRSYQGSLYRDLRITCRVASMRDLRILTVPAARLTATHRSARTFQARRISRLGNGFPVSFPTQRSCRTAASSYTTLATTPTA